ncbi:MAG: O-antigen ligase family protein [Acidimicrobiales bacterium]|jgi:O-antigen ligase|nr:O-antigen ligase family protein [Acidimicrobiales bacterium]
MTSALRSTPRPDRLPALLWALLVVPLGTLAAWVGIALADGLPRILWVAPLGLTAAVAGVVLACWRFEWFVLTVLAVRASLDVAKLGPSSGRIEVATAIGLLLVVTTVVWLVRPRHVDGWTGPSLLTRVAFAFLGAVALSAVLAGDRGASLTEVARVAVVVALLAALDRLLVDAAALRRALVAVALSALVPLAVAAAQALGVGGAREIGGFERVRGTFLHPNPFAMYACILLVMAVALVGVVSMRRRPVLLVGIGALGLALVGTYARGAWIAAVVGVATVAVVKRSRLLALVLVVGLAAVVVAVPSAVQRFADLDTAERGSGDPANSLSWRLSYWRDAMPLAERNPVTGIGLGMVSQELDEGVPPHNDYVRIFVETGVVGLIAFVGLLLALVVTARTALRRAPPGLPRGVAEGFAGVLAAVLVLAVTANLISQVVVVQYVFAFAAMAVAAGRLGPTRRGVASRRAAPPVQTGEPLEA